MQKLLRALVVLNIVGAMYIFILSFIRTTMTDLHYEFSLLLAGIVWTVCCFFTRDYFLVIVPENKAWIMSNSLIQESSERVRNFSGNRDIHAQTEFQSGLNFKYPWETKATEIDMQKMIAVESDGKQEYTLGSGKTMKIKWLVQAIPMPGHLVSFNRVREEDIKRRVAARVEAFIQGYMGDKDTASFGRKEQDKMKEAFEKIYGGKSDTDSEEEEMGIWTGTPVIYDIDAPEEVQKAKNFQIEMEAIMESVKNMVDKSGGALDYNTTLRMVLLAKAGTNPEFIDIAPGLFTKNQPKNQPGRGNKKKGGTP